MPVLATLGSQLFGPLAAAALLADAGTHIIEHVTDHAIAWGLPGFSKAVFLMMIAFVLVLLGVWRAVRGYDENGVPCTRWAQMIDPFVEHFYRDVAVRFSGEEWAPKVAPLLLNFFFFILTLNLLGLVPISDTLGLSSTLLGAETPDVVDGQATATGNYSVTSGLAVITFVAIFVFGVARNGLMGHLGTFAPHGHPFLVRWFLLLPIEILSALVKPFALTMRLAANMTAGHMGIIALLGLIFILKNAFVGIPVVLLALGLMLLEIIVSFVQAYVFALLSGVFIGMALHPHH
jgi:F-type H+-transporting ATPase subunit a